MFLSDNAEKYWSPIYSIRQELCNKYQGKTVLEIGPGVIPFEVATHFVDCTENKEYEKIDIDKDQLPYSDCDFDFLYARHVVEDIQNPGFAFKEMIRVAKSGYIETPSPLVECTKNVDGKGLCYLYRGYIHHRYIVWTETDTNTLCFLPKCANICGHVFYSLTMSFKGRYIYDNLKRKRHDKMSLKNAFSSKLVF
jgi:hypothetical protein